MNLFRAQHDYCVSKKEMEFNLMQLSAINAVDFKVVALWKVLWRLCHLLNLADLKDEGHSLKKRIKINCIALARKAFSLFKKILNG